MTTPAASPLPDRYDRQSRYAPMGAAGQARIRAARVAVVGCGALGSSVADQLVRAGVGSLRIIDRDFIDLSNLQRQPLFDEDDIAAGLPKAEAAARRLRRVNRDVDVGGEVADLNAGNAERLCGDVDVIVDGTDNVETRYLINDLAVQRSCAWVYGGCVGSEGRVLAIVPMRTPCLRCVWEDPPPPGTLETCDTAGVLMPAAATVASLQVVETLKLLTGQFDALSGMLTVDVWSGRVRALRLARGAAGECPCCERRQFEFLSGGRAAATTTLCGRNAVQILPAAEHTADFDALARRVAGLGTIERSAYMLRIRIEPHVLTVFRDGRVIVQGTTDAAVARGVVAKYIGS